MSDIDSVLSEEPYPNSDIKMGVGFSFRPIEMENLVEVTNFESNEKFQSMKRALTSHFRPSPAH